MITNKYCYIGLGSVESIAAARIPHSWDEQIRAILLWRGFANANETGRTPSQVVKEAIGQYLEKTDPNGVESMARRLAALEKQVRKLV